MRDDPTSAQLNFKPGNWCGNSSLHVLGLLTICKCGCLLSMWVIYIVHMHTCVDMFNLQFVWHLWNKHIETVGLFPGFLYCAFKCIDVLVCFAVFMSTPCPLLSLPSVFLAQLLSVANEVMTYTYIHTLSRYFIFLSLAIQQHFPIWNDSLNSHMTHLCCRTQTLTHKCSVPGVSVSKEYSWTATVLNLLVLPSFVLPLQKKNWTSEDYVSSSNSWMLSSAPTHIIL